jgi:hypothetical protein
MEPTDRLDFGQRLVGLAEVFDVKLSPQRQALYFEALRDLPYARVATALGQAVQALKFFPKPVELRDLAIGNVDDRAEVAWLSMRKAMRGVGSYASLLVADAALGETIIAMFGTWPDACATDLSPEMWASKRKEFGRIYRVVVARGVTGSRYLTGLCEQANQGRRDWMRFVDVVRLEGSGEIARLSLEQAEVARTQIAARSAGFTRLGAGETFERHEPGDVA